MIKLKTIICSKCYKEKSLNKFSKDKRRSLGYQRICKKCRSEKQKKLYRKKKEGKNCCLVCKKWFIPEQKNNIYCKECQPLIDNGKIQIVKGKKFYIFNCKKCNTEYKTKDFRNDKYCSIECFHESNKLESINCKHCGKKFKPKSSEENYCSYECKQKDNPKECKWCGKKFLGPKHKKYCSDRCREKATCRRKYNGKTKQGICKECGKEFINNYGEKRRNFCSSKCNKRYSNRIRKDKKRNKFIELVPLPYIIKRDKGICQICGCKVSKEYNQFDMKSPTRDHIIPVSKGGEHSKRNIQLACLKCNSTKNNGSVGSQMRLFG